jgi:hypothetical protein
LNFGRLLEFVFQSSTSMFGGSLILLKNNSKHRCNIINDNTNTAATGKSVNWLVYFTSMCLCLWLLLDGMSEWWKNGTAGGAGSHHGWKKWKRRTAAALNYRYRRASSDHLDIDTTHL